MAAVTLTTLRTRTRTRADMPSTVFVPDTELDAFINEGVAVLHEKLVEAYGESYAFTSSTISTTAGTVDYALPATFFKLYGLEVTLGGRTKTLKPFMFNERNFFKTQGFMPYMGQRYCLIGSNVRFAPDPGTNTYTIYFAPAATLLTAGADTVNFPNGWEKYVVTYAAIQMLIKEESSTVDLRADQEEQEKQLKALKESRDNSFPKQTVDMDAVNYYDDFTPW